MKVKYTTKQVDQFLHNIIRELYTDEFKPDYIVGLTRGGLVPAVQLSHYLKVPMNALKVALDENNESESNCWMAEDAFGYDADPKNILIVDDICDTGLTFNWIIRDWQSNCMRDNEKWNNIWHNNVRFASVIYNEESKFDIDYAGYTINKLEKPEWCIFPWEEWW